MRSKTYLLALNGVIAAAYAALTLVAAALNLAYGPVQFRFSEALTVLPFLFPGTWPGVFVGCLVANLLSPYGPLDVVLGSAGTLVAALLTQKAPKTWLAPLPPVVCGMVLLGGMLAWYEVGFSDQFLPLFAANALWVGIGQAVSCYGLGLPLLRALRKVSYFRRFIPEDRRAFGLRPESKKTAASPARGEAAALILGHVFPRPASPGPGCAPHPGRCSRW